MFVDHSLKEKAERFFEISNNHMGKTIGIEFTHIAKDILKAEMPVNENTIQPFGILHGGASVVLSETLCSMGGWFLLDSDDKAAVGLEINANHIRSVKAGGKVTGTAKPINIGRKIQVWECEIRDEREKLVCISRCTLAVVKL